jgi:hypothetical protein
VGLVGTEEMRAGGTYHCSLRMKLNKRTVESFPQIRLLCLGDVAEIVDQLYVKE